jgi:hypothetical protein
VSNYSDIPLRTSLAKNASDEDDRSTYVLLKALQPFMHHQAQLSTIPPGTVQHYFQRVGPEAHAATERKEGMEGIKGRERMERMERVSTMKYVGPVEHQSVLTDLLTVFARERAGIKLSIVAEEEREEWDALAEATMGRAGQESKTGKDGIDGKEGNTVNAGRATKETKETKVANAGKPLHAASLPSSTLYGSDPVSYTGSATAVGDFDGDGLPDLCVSSYGTGVRGVSR